MSTIKIEFESEDNAVVTAVAALTNSLLGKKANGIEVVEAEEVKPEAPAKAPTPRASRAKAKPEPTPVVEEEEIEEEPAEEVDELDEEEEIDADDIRAVQATKVDKHREVIKAKLKEFGATGISSLDPAHFVKYHDFLTKLK